MGIIGSIPKGEESLDQARRDLVAMGIAIAAILMFIGTGGRVLPTAILSLLGRGAAPDPALVSALLLNIALVLFGWRRIRDLSDEIAIRRRAEAQARQLAETDPLTGCLNRRSIGPAADALRERARKTGKDLAFAVIDLDNFKQINDFHSHQAGDALLRDVAERLRLNLPSDALIARMGGDEFACIIPFDSQQPGSIDHHADRIVTAMRQPIEWHGTELEATVSVGLVRYGDPHCAAGSEGDAMAMLHMADIAMFHAKRQGRNQIAWFSPPMETELRFRSKLESGIRKGIAAGEFVPFYEKQVDLQTGELVGFEMLARWESSTMGLVGPDLFIPVAEDIGLIADLSEALIRQSLQDARNWDPKLTLSINISPVQLRDPWFAQKLLKLLTEANFPPSRLEIEVTESCLHENLTLVRSMVTSLKNLGIRINIDDFGTGYSSLSMLRSLPFDRIKIDRTFVAALVEGDESRLIIRSILEMSRGLGLPVTAEGIENEDIRVALGEFGEMKGQGSLYGRPASRQETEDELRKLGLMVASQDAPTRDGEALRTAAN